MLLIPILIALNMIKSKKILLASWACNLQDHYQNRDWVPLFKKLFWTLIVFSPRDYYFRFGKDKMNKKFLEKVKKEQPDYILFGLSYDEFYPETLQSIKKISPQTITINFFGDDNWRYDDWSRYYALLFDYIITSEKDNSDYEKDGLKNVSFLHGISPDVFKPKLINKKYDLTFIGMPIRDRYDYLKFLHKNRIKIKIFGRGWDKHPDLKDSMGGFLESDEYVNTINQSKINLSFSKTILQGKGKKDKQLKGRIFEVAACKSFLLVEDFPQLRDFFKNSQDITFKTKEELLEKVKYYLKNETERNKLSEKLYKQVIKNYTWEAQFRDFFKQISKVKIKKKKDIEKFLMESNKKIATISEKEAILGKEEIKKLLKNSKYIILRKGRVKESGYRNFFQAYSLEKSRKQISCCDYYLNSKNLGNYMLFMTKKAFKNIARDDFYSFLDINQLMIEKEYFIKNLEKFKEIFISRDINLLNEKNTIFVSIPLVQINRTLVGDKQNIESSFRSLFLDNLYSLAYQKKLLFSLYPYILIFSSVKEPFIIRQISHAMFNKENWEKLKNRF